MSVDRLAPKDGDDLAVTALALARRFAAGATMWCLAPEWPEHARHLAVEFVHPVIMGTRALPAVAVVGDDPVDILRVAARAGDIVCAVGAGDLPVVGAVMQRACVWGLTSVWIGAGARPGAGAADHVLWIDVPPSVAAYDGSIVLRYHVLWELVHVCFEHPGLLTTTDDACVLDARCVTCSDDGVVAEVQSVDGTGAAVVRTALGTETIDVSLVAPVMADELVLVHAGTAIAKVEGAPR